MTGVPKRRGERGHRHIENTVRGRDRGRDWREAAQAKEC